jgi:hypothetical protein
MSSVAIEFGWSAPSFSEQLPALGQAEADRADAFNKAIILLAVHGVITEAERDKAIRRATHRIEEALARGAPA